jgi:hypothetical protein
MNGARIEPAAGFSFRMILPDSAAWGDSADDPVVSQLELFENGVALGPAHTYHEDIHARGLGRYSHWYDTLYFSSSDNSDPRTNGRDYLVYLPDRGSYPKQRTMAVLESLPDEFSKSEAYAAIERCLAIIYPEAKIGEDAKSFWHEAEFIDAYRRLCGENYRAIERKFAIYGFVSALAWAEGDWAECGVYNGSTAYFMALANEKSDASRHLYLFDSFEGLSPPSTSDGTYWRSGALAVSEDVARKNLSGFRNVHIRRGWIPERFDEVSGRSFSFVHVDVDLYQPTRDSIAFFYPRIRPGGMLLCDDYGFLTCPGARLAMDEFFRDKPERIIHLPTGQGLVLKR